VRITSCFKINPISNPYPKKTDVKGDMSWPGWEFETRERFLVDVRVVQPRGPVLKMRGRHSE